MCKDYIPLKIMLQLLKHDRKCKCLVGMEGVEPPRLAALGSKPSVSTSSTTSPD